MARPIWSGSLSFGLVNIPVNLYSAVKTETLKFHLLRKEDFSPIKYLKVAKADNKEVPYDDIVRGFEKEKGNFVIVDKSDFEKANVKKTKSIEITQFTDESEIDPIFFEKPYWLEPARGVEKAFSLLLRALKKTKKVGIASFVLREREHLGAIMPHENSLLLEQLHFKEEIKPDGEVNIKEVENSEKEMEMAEKIIEGMTEDFKIDKYKDKYSEELKEAIEEKAEKGTIQPKGEAPTPTNINDLMEELRKSLEKTGAKK